MKIIIIIIPDILELKLLLQTEGKGEGKKWDWASEFYKHVYEMNDLLPVRKVQKEL